MEKLWERIEAALEGIDPELLENLLPPAPEKMIARAERTLGVRFPDDFRESLGVHEGSFYMIDGWALNDLERTFNRWKTNDRLVAEGVIGLGDDPLVKAIGPVRAQRWNRRWVPVLRNESEDDRALDLDPAPGGVPGQVIEYFRDMPRVRVVAPGLRATLEEWADDLEKGRYEVTRAQGMITKFEKRP
jgi:cell wall assembly regulator SMI1